MSERCALTASLMRLEVRWTRWCGQSSTERFVYIENWGDPCCDSNGGDP